MNILVTAGPTREHIDPVRFISNRSSGKMGYSIAGECARRGHRVLLISGPVTISVPRGVKVVRVESAAEMLVAVKNKIRWCHVLIMAAAVADFTPRRFSHEKIKKRRVCIRMDLKKTVDILMSVRKLKESRIFIGFAAESSRILLEAHRKMREKKLDLIVANDITRKDAGFGADTNRVIFVSRNNTVSRLPLMKKTAVAARILDWVEQYHAESQ